MEILISFKKSVNTMETSQRQGETLSVFSFTEYQSIHSFLVLTISFNPIDTHANWCHLLQKKILLEMNSTMNNI